MLTESQIFLALRLRIVFTIGISSTIRSDRISRLRLHFVTTCLCLYLHVGCCLFRFLEGSPQEQRPTACAPKYLNTCLMIYLPLSMYYSFPNPDLLPARSQPSSRFVLICCLPNLACTRPHSLPRLLQIEQRLYEGCCMTEIPISHLYGVSAMRS